MTRIRLWGLFSIGLFVCFLVYWVAFRSTPVTNFDQLPEVMPYTMHQEKRLRLAPEEESPGVCALADIDGDGIDEIVLCTYRGLLCMDSGTANQPRIVPWQHNFIPQTAKHTLTMYLSLCQDINNDGIDEVILTYRTSPSEDWHLYIFDSAGGEATRDYTLPSYIDRDENGIWDGNYYAVGLLANATPAGGPGIVLVTEVGYDYLGRGLSVIDPVNGDTIWKYDTSCNPVQYANWIGDIDGDGLTEIIISGSSPANMRDGLINGYNDSGAMVYAISHTGELKWVHQIGAHYFTPHFCVADLDGDNSLEVVVSTHHHSKDHGDTLAVLEGATGERISWANSPVSYFGLYPTKPDRRGYCRIICGSMDGVLRKYRFENNELLLEAEATTEGQLDVVAVYDIIPDHKGEEIVIARDDSLNIVLDLDFHPLAKAKTECPLDQSGQRTFIWSDPLVEDLFVLTNTKRRQAFWFTTTDKPIVPPLMLAAFFGIATVAVGLRHRDRLVCLVIGPAGKREQLIRVNRELELIGHSNMSVLQDYAATHETILSLADNDARREKLVPQILSRYHNFNRSGHGQLIEALRTARRVGFERKQVDTALKSLRLSMQLLDQLVAKDFPHNLIAARQDDLKSQPKRLAQSLKGIKRELKILFNENLVKMLSDLLAAHEEAFTVANIEVRFEVDGVDDPCRMSEDEAERYRCMIYTGDLEFILINLIDNARKAMMHSEKRRLGIQINRDRKYVNIIVSDTGCGIASEDRELIFKHDYSSGDGGQGLGTSKKMLERWHSELELLDSQVGVGSRFVLKLRLLKLKDEQASDAATV